MEAIPAFACLSLPSLFGSSGLRDCTATLRSLIQHLVLLSLLVVAPGSNRVCSSYPDQLGISIFGAPSDNRLFPFGVDTILGRSLGTGYPVWYFGSAGKYFSPPLGNPMFIWQIPRSENQPRTGEIIFDDFMAVWPSG